jgi:phospholipase C
MKPVKARGAARNPSRHATSMALVLTAFLGISALLPTRAYAASPAATSNPAQTPIEHLVVLMQENHTFDNYFGTFPGADGIPPDVCQPIRLSDPSQGCIRPFHNEQPRTADPDHSSQAAREAFNEGAMNGFAAAQTDRNLDPRAPMAYWDGRDLPLYWNLATDYTLGDRFFSSALGASQTNHMFWITGQSGGGGGIPKEGYSMPTIFDRLQEKGISWKMYVQNFDPNLTFRSSENHGPQVIWAPLLAFPRFIDTPSLRSHIVDLSEYFDDLRNGTLPEVSYLVPSGSSEHPPGNVITGQNFGASLVTALMRSDAWLTSFFVLTHDDWGGYYDHVPPPQVDAEGYGFRVPALFISPYSRRGAVDHTIYDYTSILKFIESNWGLEPLTARDATANSIAASLDFRQPASEPRFPETVYGPPPVASTGAPRLILLAAYASVVVLFLIGLLLLVIAPSGGRLRRGGRIRRSS